MTVSANSHTHTRRSVHQRMYTSIVAFFGPCVQASEIAGAPTVTPETPTPDISTPAPHANALTCPKACPDQCSTICATPSPEMSATSLAYTRRDGAGTGVWSCKDLQVLSVSEPLSTYSNSKIGSKCIMNLDGVKFFRDGKGVATLDSKPNLPCAGNITHMYAPNFSLSCR